ncbi:MAG: amidase [Thermomicrobiales bacterium]|nr:amidase [Thermomicrobiales bacterium]
MSIVEASSRLRAGALSSVELTASVLERMQSTDDLVQAWVAVDSDRALETARACDDALARGSTLGPLHGIPIGIKDLVDVAGLPTRCGARLRERAGPAMSDAAVITSLRDAGAVLLGKTVTHEFAAGVTSAPARNPWDTSRVPGGSSGGSAAAVAVGSATGSLGSDTGGSIRIPASICGAVGFKPTLGRVDITGVFPLSWTLDTLGPLARSVQDATLLFGAMQRASGVPLTANNGRKRRLGVPRSYFFERLQPAVARSVEASLDRLRDSGFELIKMDWPAAWRTRMSNYTIFVVEAAALHSAMVASDPDGYSDGLRGTIEEGRRVSSATYLGARQLMQQIATDIDRTFDELHLDALVTPATPATAIPCGQEEVHHADGSTEHVAFAYTRFAMPFNVTGQPALSIPCGVDDDGLPIGLQVVGRQSHDAALLALGRLIEESLQFQLGFPAFD